ANNRAIVIDARRYGVQTSWKIEANKPAVGPAFETAETGTGYAVSAYDGSPFVNASEKDLRSVAQTVKSDVADGRPIQQDWLHGEGPPRNLSEGKADGNSFVVASNKEGSRECCYSPTGPSNNAVLYGGSGRNANYCAEVVDPHRRPTSRAYV